MSKVNLAAANLIGINRTINTLRETKDLKFDNEFKYFLARNKRKMVPEISTISEVATELFEPVKLKITELEKKFFKNKEGKFDLLIDKRTGNPMKKILFGCIELDARIWNKLENEKENELAEKKYNDEFNETFNSDKKTLDQLKEFFIKENVYDVYTVSLKHVPAALDQGTFEILEPLIIKD